MEIKGKIKKRSLNLYLIQWSRYLKLATSRSSANFCFSEWIEPCVIMTNTSPGKYLCCVTLMLQWKSTNWIRYKRYDYFFFFFFTSVVHVDHRGKDDPRKLKLCVWAAEMQVLEQHSKNSCSWVHSIVRSAVWLSVKCAIFLHDNVSLVQRKGSLLVFPMDLP